MTINSKQKGARFERTLAAKLRDEGYECRRTQQYCGNTGDASDVIGLPGIHIEAKNQERMHLYDWMAQAIHDAKDGLLPTVFHKKNNAEILVTMRFTDWIKIYREWECSR
jgi:Holliday junction resolvase